jgi:antitoxin (DNA-binding transcriptional repressor) of toxin-antitoxin stability system
LLIYSPSGLEGDMRVSAKEVGKKFEELVALAQRGEQVMIEQGDKLVAEIVPSPQQRASSSMAS